MTALALVIVIVGFIVAAHQVLSKAETGSAELRRTLREIEDARAMLARKTQDLVGSAKSAEEMAQRYEDEAASLVREADGLAASLDKLIATPRDRVYVSDRNTARAQRLWEVSVTHEAKAKHPVEGFARSWSTGRLYLLTAETEKLAKQRAELRFPGVQGFRIIAIKPATVA